MADGPSGVAPTTSVTVYPPCEAPAPDQAGKDKPVTVSGCAPDVFVKVEGGSFSVREGLVKGDQLSGGIRLSLGSQAFSGFVSSSGAMSLNIIPDTSGRMKQATLSLDLQDRNGKNINLTLALSSQASALAFGLNSQGDVTFQVQGIRITPIFQNGKKGLNGGVSVSGNAVDLSNPNLELFLPSLQVKLNKTSDGKLHIMLLGEPVLAPQVVHDLPTDLEAWKKQDSVFWQRWKKETVAAPFLFNFDATLAEQLSLAGLSVPLGTGHVRGYLKSNAQDGQGRSIISLTADAQDERSMKELGSALLSLLEITREHPSAPAREYDDGEPVYYSEAQDPQGTIFFTRYNENGQTWIDPKLISELIELGFDKKVAEQAVTDGQIPMSAILDKTLENPALKGHMDRQVLRDLLLSYFQSPAQGNLGSIGHRGFIAVLRLLKTADSNGLEDLLQDKDGGRKIGTHDFCDDVFHKAGTKKNDGTDSQFRAVLPLSPEEALIKFQSRSSVDPWLKINGSQINLLGREYSFQQLPPQKINGIVFLKNRIVSDNAVYEENLRFVPVNIGGRAQTLVLMEVYRDQEGDDQALSYPRVVATKMGEEAPLDIVADLVSSINSQSDLTTLGADRFTALMSGLSGVRYINDGQVTCSKFFVDYLTYAETPDKKTAFLKIDDLAKDSKIIRDLDEKLGVDAKTVQAWLVRRPLPTGEKGRFIDLEELRKATRLDGSFASGRSLNMDTFRSLIQFVLSPPEEYADISQYLTAKTDRCWQILHQLQVNLGNGRDNVVTPHDGKYPVNGFIFEDPAYRAKPIPGDNEASQTSDTFISFFIPDPESKLKTEKVTMPWLDVDSYDSSSAFTKSDPYRVPSGVNFFENKPGRIYAIQHLYGIGNDYAIYSPEIPGTRVKILPGDFSFTGWGIARIPGIENGMTANHAFLLAFPIFENGKRIGWSAHRYGLVNLRGIDDQQKAAKDTAIDQIPKFNKFQVKRTFHMVGVDRDIEYFTNVYFRTNSLGQVVEALRKNP